MAKGQITGLVISPGAIEWATLRAGKNRPGSVLDAGRVEPGVPRKPEDPEALSEASSRLKTETRGVKGGVTVGLPSGDLLLRVLDLPIVEPEELPGIVELQADKFSPFPIENMVVSHEVLRQTEDSSTVLVAAIQSGIVESLGTLLHGAGLSAARIDAEVLGWWHLLKESRQISDTGRHLIVLLASDTPEIVVVQDGIPVVFRSLDEMTGMTDEDLSAEITHEVGYTLMTLELEHGEAGADSISICSLSGQAPAGLAEKLREECACDILLKPLASLPSLAEGLARRSTGSQAVLDLMPAAWHESGKSKQFRKRVILTACAVLGLWLAVVGGFLGALYFQKSRLETGKAELEALDAPATAVKETRERVRIIRRYMDRTHSSLECLREISTVQPAGIELTSFTYRKGEQVKIVGEGLDVTRIFEFKNKLDGSGLFTRTTLHGPRFDRRKRKQIFDIEMDLPGNNES
ncbi:PilN domain-containing protein [Verrucomicrobiota bacterium]